MRYVLAAVIVGLAGCSASGDGDYAAPNGLVVERLDDARFTIPYRGKSGAPAFWCAAGRYVIEGRDMGVTTPIWRVSEPPRRSGEGITFSLSPDGAASKTGLVDVFGRGAAISAERARELCVPADERD